MRREISVAARDGRWAVNAPSPPGQVGLGLNFTPGYGVDQGTEVRVATLEHGERLVAQ